MKTNGEVFLEKWMDGINRKDVNAILNLYHADAILIPTFSNLLLDNQEKRRNYFEKLAERKGLEISIHRKTIREQKTGMDASIISGIYTWKYQVEEELLTFEARFSFVIEQGGERPIIHHHSSQIPRTM